ncbi:MAG: hypothetical protein LZF86_80132 [Nitrospira sp.]|nr:MAG: hypothetical protein LZF86_80132 [Nitrospira sp.]
MTLLQTTLLGTIWRGLSMPTATVLGALTAALKPSLA